MRKRLITTMTALVAVISLNSTSYANDAAPEAPESAETAVLDAGAAETTPTVPELPEASTEAAEKAPETTATVKVPENTTEALGLAGEVAERMGKAEWLPVFGLALFIIIWALRNWVFGKVNWFQTTMGGNVLAYGTAVVLYVGTQLQAGIPFSIGMLTTALGAAWAAKGGRADLKKARAKSLGTLGENLT